MRRQHRPGVIFQPRTSDALWRGVRQMVDVVRPTLGPISRRIGIDRAGTTPELLDNAGLIARRVTQLADPDEDMGAMYLRSVLWRMHEDIGDGTTTTALLFGTILEGALRYLAAGGNAMLLRRQLEARLADIMTALDRQVTPVGSRAQVEGLALSLCHDPSLADLIGEAFDAAGPDGRIDVRKGHGRESFIELVPGSYWDGGLVPKQPLSDSAGRRVELNDAQIVISDLDIENPQDLAPLVPLIELEGLGPLMIVAAKFSDKALNLLHFMNRRMGKTHVVAIKAPEPTDVTARRAALDDLAVLTGGRVLMEAAGDTLKTLRAEDLGTARQVWADTSHFGIVNGQGNPQAVLDQIRALRKLYNEQADDQRKTLVRIGQLLGGTVTVMVGGLTERDLEQRESLVRRTVNVLRYGLREGVVPGGGVALLNCQPVLRAQLSAADADQRAACTILLDALEAPVRALVYNAGHNWSEVAAQIQQAGPGYGCDVLSGEVVDMRAAGIWDTARVTKEAIKRAVSGAALLLTTDTLIHKRKPQAEFQSR